MAKKKKKKVSEEIDKIEETQNQGEKTKNPSTSEELLAIEKKKKLKQY